MKEHGNKKKEHWEIQILLQYVIVLYIIMSIMWLEKHVLLLNVQTLLLLNIKIRKSESVFIFSVARIEFKRNVQTFKKKKKSK